jgi:hypothetical protein
MPHGRLLEVMLRIRELGLERLTPRKVVISICHGA